MAAKRPNDLLSRLADAGEKALRQLGDTPGMDRVTAFANSTKERLDELSKRVQGIGELEKRLEKLERQVAAMSRGGTASKRAPAKRSPAKRSSAKRSAS